MIKLILTVIAACSVGLASAESGTYETVSAGRDLSVGSMMSFGRTFVDYLITVRWISLVSTEN